MEPWSSAIAARLFRVAFRITGNEADAEDVVQEAFLRGYRKLESFESRSDFGTWIYRIAVRCALNKIGGAHVDESSRVAEQSNRSKTKYRWQIRPQTRNGCCLAGKSAPCRRLRCIA